MNNNILGDLVMGTKITKKNKYKYSSPERLKRGSPKNFSLLANKKKDSSKNIK